MGNLKQAFVSSAPIKREIRTETDPATGTVTREEWFKDGNLDRADGPAVVWRDATTGTVTREGWWKDGNPDRADGPAVIWRDAATDKVTREEWWKDGEQIAPPSAAAKPEPAPQP
jgi:hypothetical protein